MQMKNVGVTPFFHFSLFILPSSFASAFVRCNFISLVHRSILNYFCPRSSCPCVGSDIGSCSAICRVGCEYP
jgi:hypothetical protein